jgi:endogenous inhibitor of DNA gyrase (YacG/DUF329 family)
VPAHITCQQCGTTLVIPPSRAGRKKYCSRRCYGAWMAENMTGEKAIRYGMGHSEETRRKISETQKTRGISGPKAWNWKGGRHVNAGYAMINANSLDSHERALFGSMVSSQSIPEHRLVMARLLGRPLRSDEQVHHVNGVRTDNRPENLELHNQETHSREHARIAAEIRRLQQENADLRAALLKCSCATSLTVGASTLS